MRTMQPRFVEIINTSDTPRELRDPALGAYPDDRVTLAAKERRRVPVATFLRLQHLPYIMRAERYEAMEGKSVRRERRPSADGRGNGQRQMNADERDLAPARAGGGAGR